MTEPRIPNPAAPRVVTAQERDERRNAVEAELLAEAAAADVIVSVDYGTTEAERAAETERDREVEQSIAEHERSLLEHEVGDPEIEEAERELNDFPEFRAPADFGDEPDLPEADPQNVPLGFERPTPFEMETERPPVQVLVIGSHGWTNGTIISAVLEPFFDAHSDREIIVATSGDPGGAEGIAASYAQYRRAQTVGIRDEHIQPGMFAKAFAFMLGSTPGAQRTLDAAAVAGIPITRVGIDETPERSAWSDR